MPGSSTTSTRSTAPEALVLRGLSKRYGPIRAVVDAALMLEHSRVLALLGPSGCGKTTLLRLIAGFEVPDSGAIRIADRIVVDESGVSLPPEQRRIGMVFQDYALFPHLNVGQNIAYGLPRNSKRDARVAELLELVGLAGAEKRMPHQLSGGQQQRVALARALAPRPELMLLDEPFSNLDAGLRRSVRAEVQRILAAEGVAAVFVTHDQEEALSLADRVAVMLAGEVVQTASPREIYERPVSRAVAAFVGAANFVPAQAGGSTANSLLGPLPLIYPHKGRVDLLIRPEALRLSRDPAGPYRVIACNYFGADQLVSLDLGNGNSIQARTPAWATFNPGDAVQIAVHGAVMAYEPAVG
ncbi:MAG: ABC transporter ATP-binding protein [Oscillochloris sp.]|nr:ABC transporter ATP-binding protein [Oscillochloris sp.]